MINWPNAKQENRKKREREKKAWVWWFTPLTSALWEAKIGGSQGQEIQTILVNMVKPRLY